MEVWPQTKHFGVFEGFTSPRLKSHVKEAMQQCNVPPVVYKLINECVLKGLFDYQRQKYSFFNYCYKIYVVQVSLWDIRGYEKCLVNGT